MREWGEAMETSKIEMENKRIAALDGIRTISIIFIMWLHIWEQSWLTPYIDFNNVVTRYFGITESYLQRYVRFGAVFVEMMILLCAVCNFLPYARSIVLGEPWPDAVVFWKKRAIRILPSYYLAVVIPFLISVFTKNYDSVWFALKDFLSDITFTNIFFERLNVNSQINGVLWTVQTEVWIYLLFPFLAKAMKKKPFVTLGSLWGVGLIVTQVARYNFPNRIRSIGIYNPLNYLILLANGFLIMVLYYKFYDLLQDKYVNALGVLITISSIVWFNQILRSIDFGNAGKDIMLIENRVSIELCFTAILVGILLSGKISSVVLGNKFFAYMSGILYNLYLWHQWIAVTLKKWKIPNYEGDVPPNEIMDVAWSRKYSLIIVILSFAVAILVTKFYEKPISEKLRARITTSDGIKRKPEKKNRTIRWNKVEKKDGTDVQRTDNISRGGDLTVEDLDNWEE